MTYLDHFISMLIGIHSNCAHHLDARSLRGPVGQRQRHLLVGEGVGGVRPERELGAEHRLPLETRTLSNVQMVVVALQQNSVTIIPSLSDAFGLRNFNENICTNVGQR